MKDEFSRLHPLVNLIFYGAIFSLTMFQMQVGLIIISLTCAAVYYFYLKRRMGIRYFVTVVGIIVISAFINPLFSHKGSTLLFYMFTGNPVTLESVIYGICAATILGAMLLWFSNFNETITADRLLAGLGAAMPHVATLLSMIFRFVPKFIRQQRAVVQANKALGEKTEGLKNKIKFQMDVFSITATWALENSVDTADSMRARGYGTGRRTYYMDYKMRGRDIAVGIWIILLYILVWIELITGKAYTYYYPVIRIKGNIILYITYILLGMTPMIINVWENWKWHKLTSGI